MKGIKAEIRSKWYLRWLLLISNWISQGIKSADTTEKIYKISFTIISSSIFYYLLSFYTLETFLHVLGALFFGHTLNYIINSNFKAILVHYLLITNVKKDQIFKYLHALQNRLNKKNWILYSATFGSISKGALKSSSDVDVSIVRKPGFINAIKSLCFLVIEKKRADFCNIPLELWLSDTPENSKKRFKMESIPVIIIDDEYFLRSYYSKCISIEEAQKLNKI